jgi:hypothetical protein
MNGTHGRELTLYYSDADGLLGRAALVCLTGLPATVSLWLLFLCVNQLRIMAGVAPTEFDNLQLVRDPSGPLEVIGAGAALLVFALPLSLLAAWFAVLGWRSARGRWWLRLTSEGFEVNDRLWRPRRYWWSEIDRFTLVGRETRPDAEFEPRPQTFTDAVGGGATPQVVRVGFRYVPELRTRPHRTADEYVMGWWDRPFSEAVDLMNEWVARYGRLPRAW